MRPADHFERRGYRDRGCTPAVPPAPRPGPRPGPRPDWVPDAAWDRDWPGWTKIALLVAAGPLAWVVILLAAYGAGVLARGVFNLMAGL